MLGVKKIEVDARRKRRYGPDGGTEMINARRRMMLKAQIICSNDSSEG